MDIKYIVDILSSIASIIAICTVLFSWHKNKRPILGIENVVIYRESESKFKASFIIKNQKPYPIKIENIVCYIKESTRIEKMRGAMPKIRIFYDVNNRIFSQAENATISENGESRFNAIIKNNLNQPKSLVFLIYTSHGYLKLKTKKIKFFNQRTFVLAPEFMLSVSSTHEKLIIYTRGVIVQLIEYLPFKLEKLKKLIIPKGIN